MAETRDQVLEALRTLVRVYTNCGNTGLAGYMRLRLDLYETGSPDFINAITSPEMWWDVPDNMPSPDSLDWVPYLLAVNALADYVIGQHLGTDLVRRKAASVAEVNRQRLKG